MGKPRPRTWLRRIFGTFAGGGLALVILAYALVGYRASIPAARAHGRVAPRLGALPVVRACWIETAEAFGSTASTLWVRHPSGDLVVDVSNSTHFEREIEAYGFADRLWYRAVPGPIVPGRSIAQHLRSAGADPAHVRVFLTHAHFDHAGGMLDMPDVPVLAPQPEIDLVHRARRARHFEVLTAHAQRLAPLMTPVVFGSGPYETFDASADLYGDGSLVAVPLPGHTPGSQGLFVNVSRSQRLFLIGDVAHDSRGYLDRVDKPFLTRRTDSEPALAQRTLARVAQFHRMVPSVQVIPAHARDAWIAAFGAPGRCL